MATKKRKKPAMKTFKVNIYYCYDKTVYVRARTERSALAIGRRRVAKSPITLKATDLTNSDAEEVFNCI